MNFSYCANSAINEDFVKFVDELKISNENQYNFIKSCIDIFYGVNKKILLTASAGCGKTFIINKIVDQYKKFLENYSVEELINKYSDYRNYHKYDVKNDICDICKNEKLLNCNPNSIGCYRSIYNDVENIKKSNNCVIAAPTGIAAMLVSGITLYKLLNIRPDQIIDSKTKKYKLIDHIMMYISKSTFIKIRALKVLIIDEISMVSKDFLELVNEIIKRIRKSDLDFGGLSVIMIGDFCQLAPVEKSNNVIYAFESEIFNNIELHIFTKCYRTSNEEFTNILNEFRYGIIQKHLLDNIISKYNSIIEPNDDEVSTTLVCTNAEADVINNSRLLNLSEKHHKIRKTIRIQSYHEDKKYVDNYIKELRLEKKIILCEGCHIIVTKNIDEKVVNGTQGIVKKINKDNILIEIHNGQLYELNMVDQYDEEGLKVFKYLPIKLAYAITCHKSQGMSIERLIIDFKNINMPGQAYTAISRSSNPVDGLYLINFPKNVLIAKKKIRCNPKVKNFYYELLYNYE